MTKPDDLFIGWAPEAPPADRRFLLGAGIGLIAAAAGLGAASARRTPAPGPGRWDQGAIAGYTGLLVESPYPTLLVNDPAGDLRPHLLVGYGKVALPPRAGGPGLLTVEASAITRGAFTMLAVQDAAAYAALPQTPAAMAPAPEEDLGPALRAGEILDAKCWFGAMNPGLGLTHKACAALCARGRLPLAFCEIGACGGTDEICLLLDADGRPHGPELIPYLADPVLADGRLFRRHGLLELRVNRSQIRRI